MVNEEVCHADTASGRLRRTADRAAAKRSKDGAQARRLLALAAIYDGGPRTEAARIGGVTVQIVRDWVIKFNAHGPDGLVDRKAPGQPPRLNEEHRKALASVIESGPTPAIHGVVRWRLMDLASGCTRSSGSHRQADASRELRAMGYRKLSARPRHHAQAAGAIEDFKKHSPRAWTQIAREKAIDRDRDRDLVRRRGADRPEEQDHTALGPARNTSSAPRDQRTASTYIFGAICPSEGKGRRSSCPPATPRR